MIYSRFSLLEPPAVLWLLTVLGLVFFVVAATYVLRLYEWRALTPEQRGDTEERVAPWLAGTIALLWEFLVTVWLIATMPMGWLRRSAAVAKPSDRRPIVLVPGIFENAAAYASLMRFLRARGHTALFPLNLGGRSAGIEAFSARVAVGVAEALRVTGAEKVDLIAHGVGGLAARHYLNQGGAVNVANLILIGTPNQGTRLAGLFGGKLANDLKPGSVFLTALNGRSLSEVAPGTRIVNLYSTFDNWILPPTLADLPGAENHRLDYIGHAALLCSSQIRFACRRILDGTPPQPAHYYSEFPNE